MSIERARYYENLRRSTYRNAKEAFSASLERAYEGNKPDPYQSDPAVQAVEADLRKVFDASDMPEYDRLLSVYHEAKTAAPARGGEDRASGSDSGHGDHDTTSAGNRNGATGSKAESGHTPLVEKRPISAIRAEVCRVANELRKSAGMSKSMAMRESWAMVKSGRAAFPVKGISLNIEGTRRSSASRTTSDNRFTPSLYRNRKTSLTGTPSRSRCW
ncbi:MAG: hypothetical protein LBK00_10065 [Treponema sp.]|jgi:hypothetical protein|nr:hypothetical protein [Treponema sp.]